MISENSETYTLSIRGLDIRYGDKQVVRGISFDVCAGAVFGLLGPSGAGKSSVLAAITGVIPSDGLIIQGGTEVSKLPARQRRFGHVYQEFRLFDWMSIRENVAFPCEAMGWSEANTNSAVASALDRVNLSLDSGRSVRDLSGGERQRVALARAMVFRPRALLLDEPFSHLDPPLREELKRDLARMLSGESIPVVFVTHDHREAFELCERIGVMLDGTLVQQGTPSELINAPISHGVACLLGYSNSLEGRVRSATNGMTEVQVDGMPATWRCRAMAQVTAGDAVRIACRPESIHLNGTDLTSSNVFESSVVSARSLADMGSILVVSLGNWPWTVAINSNPDILAGGIIHCAIHPDDVLVYPAAKS